jgi:aryl-alcohol dehydrogenase-like predicted oxidoreductase
VDAADVAMVTYHPAYQEECEVIQRAHALNKGIFVKKAHASGMRAASIADNLRFIFEREGVTSVIVGTIDPVHLRENVQCIPVS